MDEIGRRGAVAHSSRVEPRERLVVLARTMHDEDGQLQTSWAERITKGSDLGETCLGQALYRHRSIFQSASDAPPWSNLELTYFRCIVPLDVIQDLVFERQGKGSGLLRAEILVTTPSAFAMPQNWGGSAERPQRRVSIEYIDVKVAHIETYRDIMRSYIGPAAAKLVSEDRIGTFRAMETAAILYQDPSHDIQWNQIHLCELDPDGFKGFGQEFDAALSEISPDGAFSQIFSGLDRMRSVSRWTFNDAVVEADLGLGRLGSVLPQSRP